MAAHLSMNSIFTPPSPCSTSWTYEPEGANLVEGGLIMQNAATFVSSCFPSEFHHVGRLQGSFVYSPGWCPMGYTSADIAVDGEVTTAICCLSDFNYLTQVLEYNAGGPIIYAGCTSSLPKGTLTIVPVRDETTATLITGPVAMWAQPITVALESSDSSLFVPTTSSAASVARETPGPNPTDDTSSAQNTESSSGGQLSTSSGLGIGVGVGVGVGGFAVLAAVGILLWRSRKRKREQEKRDRMERVTSRFTQPVPSYYPRDVKEESGPMMLREMDGSNSGHHIPRGVWHELG